MLTCLCRTCWTSSTVSLHDQNNQISQINYGFCLSLVGVRDTSPFSPACLVMAFTVRLRLRRGVELLVQLLLCFAIPPGHPQFWLNFLYTHLCMLGQRMAR